MNPSFRPVVLKNDKTRCSDIRLRRDGAFNHVEIAVDLVFSKRRRQILYPVNQRLGPGIRPIGISETIVVEVCPDEEAIAIDRQFCDVVVELPPIVALKEIELDIRRIERRDNSS